MEPEQPASCGLQIQCSFIGVIDMMIAVALGVILVQQGYDNIHAMVLGQGHTPSTGIKTATWLTLLIFGILLFIECAMGLILKMGADTSNIRKLKAYLFYSLTTTITSTFVFMILISMANFSDSAELALTALNLVYNVASICIVYSYAKELKQAHADEYQYTRTATA